MAANKRAGRRRRSKHRGSMKVITVIVVMMCCMFGFFTWQNTQKSKQYALIEQNLQKQIEEKAAYQKTDAYIEDLARDKLGLVHENEIIFKKK